MIFIENLNIEHSIYIEIQDLNLVDVDFYFIKLRSWYCIWTNSYQPTPLNFEHVKHVLRPSTL